MPGVLLSKHVTLTQCCFNDGPTSEKFAHIQTTLDHSQSCVVYSNCQVGIAVLASAGQSVLLRSSKPMHCTWQTLY